MMSTSINAAVDLLKYLRYRFFSSEMGVASIEYALLAGLIAMTIFITLVVTDSSLLTPLLTIYFDTYLAIVSIYQSH